MNTANRKYALTAGISLLVMSLAAAFSYGYVQGNLVVEDDSLLTYQNIANYRPVFLGGIAGWVVIFITDLVVAGSLFYYFKSVNRQISLLTAWIRIIYTAILGIAIYQLFVIIPLTGDVGVKSSIEVTKVSELISSFESIWSGGLILFGFHLLGLGYLSLRSGFVPRIFGWLFLFAGACYILVHSAKALMPEYQSQVDSVESILAVPMGLAEIAFAIWLLFRGGKNQKNLK